MIGLQRKTVFIDRNSGGRNFKDLIKRAGINIVLHDEEFGPTTLDSVWVKKIGALGWIMVTGDIAIERSYLFLSALKRSRAHVFILCALNHLTGDDRAKCIIDVYEEMLKLCHAHTGPCLWKAKPAGEILPVDFRHALGMLTRYKRTSK